MGSIALVFGVLKASLWPVGYGSSNAVSFVPNGWDVVAGTTYHVEVTGVSPSISYDVVIVSCS